VLADPRLNHRPEVVGGVLADEAAELLRSFFRARR
jgi:tRNA(adenine34) deaminase